MRHHHGPWRARLGRTALLAPIYLACAVPAAAHAQPQGKGGSPVFEPVKIPAWVYNVTRMTFAGPADLDRAAANGAQVVHFNLVWPYYPLRRDGGGLSAADGRKLHEFVDKCHRLGMRAVLGLPPFPSVALMKAHPDWRVFPEDSDKPLSIVPKEDDLGSRMGCNNGPWGDYLIDILAELMQDYHVDGYSFDGNYHPNICYCPACKAAYRRDRGRDLPKKVDLDDIGYREYLVWRGERLEDHYRRMQQRLKGINPDAVVMSWTVNAGRYGHFMSSPRYMTTRMNLLLDLPMQEWWQDESNFGASVAPIFGAAYLRAVTDDRPCASEPYLMSRGNPYGSYSFPPHEAVVRALHAVTNGNVVAFSLGWGLKPESSKAVFDAAAKCAPWMTHTNRVPWAALLVSEQTRQFYAYKDIASRFLPHVFGVFRAAMEEHLPLDLINDWDVTPGNLARYRVLVLPNSAALSNEQVAAIREYVRNGGGLVATCETSICDELGRPRADFALADVFGVSFKGRPNAPQVRPELDANFAITVDENYWKQRTGVATLKWTPTPLTQDAKLDALVPDHAPIIRGPMALVSEPKETGEVVARLTPEGSKEPPIPGIIVRPYGKGRVVYMATGVDAALYSYALPYQRRLMARAMELAADHPFGVTVEAPMCVQATFFEQSVPQGRRLVAHLFNGLNTTANHGLPEMDVPLREESVPIHGIRLRFTGETPAAFHIEPGNIRPTVRREGGATIVEVPPLALHCMVVGEWGKTTSADGGQTAQR